MCQALSDHCFLKLRVKKQVDYTFMINGLSVGHDWFLWVLCTKKLFASGGYLNFARRGFSSLLLLSLSEEILRVLVECV